MHGAPRCVIDGTSLANRAPLRTVAVLFRDERLVSVRADGEPGRQVSVNSVEKLYSRTTRNFSEYSCAPGARVTVTSSATETLQDESLTANYVPFRNYCRKLAVSRK